MRDSTRLEKNGRRLWAALLASSLWLSPAAIAEGEELIPRVPLGNPSPTCHPDPACAGEGPPMASYAVTAGGWDS